MCVFSLFKMGCLMCMLKGLRAIEREDFGFAKRKGYVDGLQNYSLKNRKMTVEESKQNTINQLSTVVKMCLDGYGIGDITQATQVCKSKVSQIKKEFGLTRPTLAQYKEDIKRVMMNSEPYKHDLESLSLIVKLKKETTRKIINSIEQIEKGTERGIKRKYRYNLKVQLGDGEKSRGRVI